MYQYNFFVLLLSSYSIFCRYIMCIFFSLLAIQNKRAKEAQLTYLKCSFLKQNTYYISLQIVSVSTTNCHTYFEYLDNICLNSGSGSGRNDVHQHNIIQYYVLHFIEKNCHTSFSLYTIKLSLHICLFAYVHSSPLDPRVYSGNMDRMHHNYLF